MAIARLGGLVRRRGTDLRRRWLPDARLAEGSEKAQQRIRLKDDGYPLRAARNAAARKAARESMSEG
jgi:hypothetical protein